LDAFSRVFWFTMEFGVLWERSELRTYGAGLLSSFGEIDAFRSAEIRPFDLAAMAVQPYDITHFQPVLFAARSWPAVLDELGSFFEGFGDEAHQRLLAG
jgi:phenylalanine-4-hydroxylase